MFEDFFKRWKFGVGSWEFDARKESFYKFKNQKSLFVIR